MLVGISLKREQRYDLYSLRHRGWTGEDKGHDWQKLFDNSEQYQGSSDGNEPLFEHLSVLVATEIEKMRNESGTTAMAKMGPFVRGLFFLIVQEVKKITAIPGEESERQRTAWAIVTRLTGIPGGDPVVVKATEKILAAEFAARIHHAREAALTAK